jgi:hypothetical protein
MPEDKRDLVGDQMGWAVRQIMPPTPELRKIDKFIMKALPRPIARAVALIRFNQGWLPEVGDPEILYTEVTKSFGQQYLDQYAEKRRINTMSMPSVGQPLVTHTSNFREGQKEYRIDWNKQINWAAALFERMKSGESLSTDDIKESTYLLLLNRELQNTFDLVKPQFEKRGLPFPQLVDTKNVPFNHFPDIDK